MKDSSVIIFGNSSYSVMIAEYVKQFTELDICCFTVNKEYVVDNVIFDLPVVDFENIEERYDPSKYKFLIALGHKNMNSLREKIFNEVEEKGYEIINFIHPSALINANEIGKGNIFLENVFIGPHAKIGNGNIFWNGVNISHNACIGSYNYFSPSTVIAGNIKISNNCFFGTNCTIRDGLNICDKTLVGAACYLSNDTLENEVYVPAKSIRLEKTSNQMHL